LQLFNDTPEETAYLKTAVLVQLLSSYSTSYMYQLAIYWWLIAFSDFFLDFSDKNFTIRAGQDVIRGFCQRDKALTLNSEYYSLKN
jgi:hypothetical protein